MSTRFCNFGKFLFDSKQLNLYNIVGDNMNKLKELRAERNLTVRGLEDKTGIKFTTYARYESEERDMSTEVLKKLSKFFEVSIDYMLCNNNYCVYAKYKEGDFMFCIRANYYEELKNEKYIYFDNNDNRCIDINSLIGVGKTNDITGIFQEMIRIEKMDSLFDKKVVKQSDIDDLDKEIYQIELTKSLVEKIKDAIR